MIQRMLDRPIRNSSSNDNTGDDREIRLVRADLEHLLLIRDIVDFRIGLHVRNVQGAGSLAYKKLEFDFRNVSLPAGPLNLKNLRVRLQRHVRTNFAPGPLRATSRKLDLVATSTEPLFFGLSNGKDLHYQRLGRFFLNAKNQIVNHRGDLLEPPVTLPPGTIAETLLVSEDGMITVRIGDDIRPTTIGRIELYAFQRPEALRDRGESEFIAGGDAGPARSVTPGTPGIRLFQGFVEQANVDVSVEELRLARLFNLRAALTTVARRLDPNLVFTAGPPEVPGHSQWTQVLNRKVSALTKNLANAQRTAFLAHVAWSPPPGKSGLAFFQFPNTEMASLRATANKFDLAFYSGNGYFRILLPDGTAAYTRNGSFKVDRKGQLVMNGGYLLDPPIILPGSALNHSFSVSENGEVTILVGTDQKPVRIGQIDVFRFANPEGLGRRGDDLFRESPRSGPAIQGTPGRDGFSGLLQGFLEASNVNEIETRVDLIALARQQEIAYRIGRYAGDSGLPVCENGAHRSLLLHPRPCFSKEK